MSESGTRGSPPAAACCGHRRLAPRSRRVSMAHRPVPGLRHGERHRSGQGRPPSLRGDQRPDPATVVPVVPAKRAVRPAHDAVTRSTGATARTSPAPIRKWRAAVAAELARRHELDANWVPKGVMTKLFIRGLEPAAAGDRAKVEYDSTRPRPRGRLRERPSLSTCGARLVILCLSVGRSSRICAAPGAPR